MTMTAEQELLTIQDAIELLHDLCPRSKTWVNPKRNLQQHTNRGNLKPAEARVSGKSIRFERSEVERFATWLNGHPQPRGGRLIVLSQDTLKLFGVKPDGEIADLVGCHRSTIYRRRRQLGIPAATKMSKADSN